MAGKSVLRFWRAALVCLSLAACLVGGGARAQDDEPDDDLLRPERLTVGVADDLLGQLSPDGKTLYYVSNRNTTNQLFAQNVSDSRAHLLFDDDADVTWPRISPDGKRLLYVSFGERAAGQLCVRNLPDGGDRRCLDDPSAALQAEWIDRDRVVLVARGSIQGDLSVLEVTMGPRLVARPLFERNLTSPAVSPDGRFLVYVPVERYVESVGPAFAARAAARLEVVRLGDSRYVANPLVLDLPGQSSQPIFSRDGRSLYVVQFFSDSNHDGVIDAGDHGVLFRVPISFAGATPALGLPEQLTDTSWNCEYPAPSKDRLIATCSKDKDLDVYALPLDGEVPSTWTLPQFDSAIESAGSRVEEQLLSSRRLALEASPSKRRIAMLGLALLHLELEQYRAAEFYAEHVAALKVRETAGVAHPLQMLVEQRRDERRRERGRQTEPFGPAAQRRLEALHPKPTASAMAVTLAHVVRSEIADSIGDKTQARAELEAANVDETTPLPIVEAYYRRADALYRSLDDREALVAVGARLSVNRGLSPDERLRYALASVRAMLRGLSFDDAGARLDRERAGAAPDSELAFALELAKGVLPIRGANAPPSVSDALIALYVAQPRPDRKHAVVTEAVRRAEQVGADQLVLALAQKNIEDVARGSAERRGAERLYRRVLTNRAFHRVALKQFAEARDDFDAILAQTNSYEAVVGSIDMRLRLGEPAAAIRARYENPAKPALSRFAEAYLVARQLPKLDGASHQKVADEAIAGLRASWPELKKKRVAQALYGALLHEEYLRTGELASAEKANTHYLIALQLAAANPRFRAMILGELGVLHAGVGNFRIALGYLLDRDQLPYADNAEGLAVHLDKARALLHVGRDDEAAATADQAVAMVERTPGLARYRTLVLDRAALDNLAAHRFARAAALYDAEMPMLDAASGSAAPRNRFVARVARAAAEVGAAEPAPALDDLRAVEERLGDLKFGTALLWPHASVEHVVRSYRLMITGLRANADRQLGRFDDEARAISERHALLLARFVQTKRGEFERQTMLAEAELSLNAGDRHDPGAASSWLRQALARSDDLRARHHGVYDQDELDVLWLAAHLSSAMRASLVPDLPKRLRAASAALDRLREPAFGSYARWFEVYEPLLGAEVAGPASTVAERTTPVTGTLAE
jgi:hypothetical protein